MRVGRETGARWATPGRAARVLLAALACLLPGCCSSTSEERCRVEGQVRIDGVPLEKGLITFAPVAPTKGPKATGVVSGGQYVIEKDAGPCGGTFLVKIETIPIEVETLAGRQGQPSGGCCRGASRPIVAPEYNRDSRLTVTVCPNGENRFHFDVKQARGLCPRTPGIL